MQPFTDPQSAAKDLSAVFVKMQWSWRTDGKPPTSREIVQKFESLSKKLLTLLDAFPNLEGIISICQDRLAVTVNIQNRSHGVMMYSLDLPSMAKGI